MIWSTPALRNVQVSSRSAVLEGMTAKALLEVAGAEGVGAEGAMGGRMVNVCNKWYSRRDSDSL